MTTKRNNKTKTIYKKTVLKVYSYVCSHDRSECKIIAKDLSSDRSSVSKALDILTRENYIKERKYSDIGVSYYYPSDKNKFCVLLFSPTVSHMLVCNGALDILEHFRYAYSEVIMPDENLHIFLKNSYKFLSEYSIQKPFDEVFLFCPYKLSDQTHEYCFPELRLIDLDQFVKERMNAQKAVILDFNYNKYGIELSRQNVSDIISFILSTKLTKSENKNSRKEEI